MPPIAAPVEGAAWPVPPKWYAHRMSPARIRRAIAALGLGLLGCRGPGNFDDEGELTTRSDAPTDESESDTGELPSSFDPLICGSWDPPAALEPGTPPPEQPCPPGGPCPVFTEVAAQAGLGTVHYLPTHPAELACIFPRPTSGGLMPQQDCEPQWFTGGVTVGDVDGDGWPDLYMTRLAAPDHLFLNRGDGTFVDIADAVGLGECSYTNGAVFGDIDNDGDLDLLVTTVGGHAYQLWINLLVETGELRFEDQAEARGFALSSVALHSGQSVTLGDFDRDGWLDVHVNEWIRTDQMPGPDHPDLAAHGSRLLRNLGDGSFTDVTEAYGVGLLGNDDRGIFAFSSTFVDIDGDGWQELAIAVDFHRSRLYWNLDGLAYLDGTNVAKVNRESNAMGSTWADVDLDGDLDWFVTSIAELRNECLPEQEPPCWASSGNRLYRYAGAREFSLMTDEAGVRDGAWAWGAAFFDADNDGDQDLVLVNGWPGRDLNGGLYHHDTPTKLWINLGLDAGVAPMSEEGEARGLFDTGQGRSVVAFDYDRDGDLDVLVINHAGSPRLFRNDGGSQAAWLRVAVQGTTSNRDGRGAKVRVQAHEGGPWQVREVGVGSHFLGEGELVSHFGLGGGFDPAADTIFRVEVEWPASGLVQSFDAVASGQTLVVVEG
jgi:enediyne biosynthesis protein E4